MKIFTIKKDKRGKYVWNIKGGRGKILASSTSEGYTRFANCDLVIFNLIQDILASRYKIVREK